MVGALLSSVAWAVPGVQAQAADIPLKAPEAGESPALWWFHGDVEVGARMFLNDPQRDGNQVRNGNNGQNGQSLAKFYEYRDLRPGPFSNFWLATGTNDGLYKIELGGKNVGYDDQRLWLDASKAGQHYFNFLWDQTPHLYSTTAQTFYQGVGTTHLTLPPGYVPAATGANIVPFLYTTDIGIKRDTAAANYRWTPDDAWDIKADYSHLHRSGTQVDGVVGFGTSFGYGPTQVPRPVDDVTQNFGLNGEYVGTSPWGQRFNFKLAYNGSVYTDAFTSYTIADPIAGVTKSGPFAAESTWPSNNANGFSGTLGADLPWNSRYAGTLSYTMMRQNESFIPMSTQNPGFPLPASSLNGAINTLLSNNIITTKITPELTSKLSYRYYNFDNETPQIFFPCQPAGAANCSTAWISYDQLTAGEKQIQSLTMQYVKQNAGADLNWRPTKEWNLGAAYGYERYDWTQADVDYTNENSGKVYADWRPMSWLGIRSSAMYSIRRYGTYDYVDFVGNIQFPNTTLASNGFYYNPAYRQLMIDNRDRWKANFAVDLVVARGVTVTPTLKYQDDHYGLNGTTELGLTDSRSWAGGVDITYVMNPDTSFTVGYEREYYTQLLDGSSSTSNTAVVGVGGIYSVQTNDTTTVDTFMAAVRYAAIPDKLNLSLRYAASHGVDNMMLNLANGTQPTGGQFPNATTWFQRLDAEAAYKFDKEVVAQLGWKGDIVAKLHYAWESNSVANWQNDPLAPFNSPALASGTSAIFMAYDNPNYNVQMLMASLGFKW
jgi:MtrB/PioB family decaheme-associated outer membrane protein